MEGGRPRNERVIYEDQPERAWERDRENRGEPDGDVPTVPQEERGEARDVEVREEGKSGGLTNEETMSPVPDEEAIAGSTEPDGDAPAGAEAEAARGESIEEAPGEVKEEEEQTPTAPATATPEIMAKKTAEEGSGLPGVSEKKRGFWRRVFGG